MINNRFMVFSNFLSCKGMKYNSDTQTYNKDCVSEKNISGL